MGPWIKEMKGGYCKERRCHERNHACLCFHKNPNYACWKQEIHSHLVPQWCQKQCLLFDFHNFQKKACKGGCTTRRDWSGGCTSRSNVLSLKNIHTLPCLVWLSGLNPSLQTRGSLVRFPVRAHAWVVGQAPGGGCTGGNNTLMFLFLSFSLPCPLSKINKIF